MVERTRVAVSSILRGFGRVAEYRDTELKEKEEGECGFTAELRSTYSARVCFRGKGAEDPLTLASSQLVRASSSLDRVKTYSELPSFSERI